jgi:hypothetical protein
VIHPWLDDLIDRVVGPVEVNLLVVTGAVAMGTVAATLAALAPARAAAKVSTIEALAGRSGAPRPPGRVAGVGLLVVVAGGFLTAWGTQTDHDIPLAAGLIAMLSGFLLSIPLLVALVGRTAAGLPMTGRLAARDAGRHGRRTGAAVAAAVIALATPVAVSTYSLSAETHERRSPRLGDDQLLIGETGGTGRRQVADDPGTVALVRDASDVTDPLARDLRREFPDALVVALETAAVPLGRTGGRNAGPAWAKGAREEIRPGVSTPMAGALFVGDDDLLRALHAEAGIDDLARGRVLTLGGFRPRDGFVRVKIPLQGGRSRFVTLPGVAVDSPDYFNESMPKFVISNAVAEDLGVAVGADPMSHRKLLAATALLLALIAAVLAVPAGLVPMIVVWSAAGQQAGFPLVIPWATIGLILVLVPVLAALVSGAVARTPKLGSLLTPAS